MKLQNINLALLSTIAISCGNTPSATIEAPAVGGSEELKSACDITTFKNNYDVDSCLKKACDEVNGTLTEIGCECPDSKVFTYTEVPKCLDFSKTVSEKSSRSGDYEFISYTAFDDEILYSAEVINYDLESDQEDFHFANFIAPNFLTITHLPDGKSISKSNVENAVRVPYIHVFQTFGDISPIDQVRFNKSMELSERAPFYSLIKEIEETPFISEQEYFYTTLGCLGLCKKEMSFDSPGLDVKRVKEYFKGILSNDQVIIKSKKQNIILLKFDLIARTILERIETSNDSREISYSLNSFSLESRGETTRELISRTEELSTTNYYNHNWGNVVLCDNGLLPSTAKRYKDAKLVKGPNSNSVYGWLTNVADQSDYFNGVLNLNNHGSSVSGVANHGFSVFSFMKESNVASISLNSCLNNFNNWAPNAFKENFKVVNYSYYDSLDSKSCLSKHVWSDVQNNPIANKMLWLFAAGNDKAYLSPKNSMHCPQNIASGLKNALVVGADPEFGGVTNKGKQFVDFFVLAPSTSTATAVASSLAANIAKKYPGLSPMLIKKSLLASVKYERLPSRTGGILDEEKSYKAAAILNKRPNISNKKLLNKLHWGYISSSWLRRFE